MNRYRNPWYKKTIQGGVEFYENDKKPMLVHRGVTVYKILDKHYDFVYEGCALTQRAGATRAIEIIDGLLGGTEVVCDAVADHLEQFGHTPRRYSS